ncbi:transglycosylase domain-containing protein [Brevibacillus ginsengisoli]|uniref:transglycosylase domain-containing protein n=1 Tax=Brevibacillus ginsengisoli TaxID=363854 RepID=UPI003CEA32A3
MEVVREPRIIRWLRRLKQLLKLTVMSTLVGAFVILMFILYLRSQPLPATTIHQTTTIYASNGQSLDEIHQGENRTVVPLKEIAPTLVQATIAIEDRSFYSHLGFDFKRLGMAAYTDIVNMSKAQGASTITQQLARNLYLSHDKTWERKLKEALLTVQLELNYSKEEILELYMNQIYYGYSAYGAEAAAQTYFGKSAKDLTLAESSMLASVPKGPTYYNPFDHYDNAKKRQKIVLDSMQKMGFISADQANQALTEKLVFQSREQLKSPATAPYFRDYISSLIKDKYGIEEDLFAKGGLKIYTTLDYDMQKKAEEIIAKELPKDKLDLQAALIAIDPSTGQIKALVGGRDYQKSQFNRVFAKRQPGSSFKAFLYLTALQQGFTPLTLMKSEPTVFTYDNGKQYTPSNFGDHYANDYITLEHAIATSDNIYAVKTIQQITPEKVIQQAQALGITSELQAVPSLALGTSPTSPYEMAAAYGTIANHGVKAKTIAITKIEDSEGNLLAEEKPESTQVVDPTFTFLLTHLMQSVFEPGGTAYRVSQFLNRPVAGKTGSTDYDAWLCGFTPQLVTAVWVGYDEGKKLDSVTDARLAAPIWAKFMESSLNKQPPTLFDVPPGVVPAYIDPINGKLATESCPNPRFMYFQAGTEPQDYCTEHLPNSKAQPKPIKTPDKQSIWQRMGKIWRP